MPPCSALRPYGKVVNCEVVIALAKVLLDAVYPRIGCIQWLAILQYRDRAEEKVQLEVAERASRPLTARPQKRAL